MTFVLVCRITPTLNQETNVQPMYKDLSYFIFCINIIIYIFVCYSIFHGIRFTNICLLVVCRKFLRLKHAEIKCLLSFYMGMKLCFSYLWKKIFADGVREWDTQEERGLKLNEVTGDYRRFHSEKLQNLYTLPCYSHFAT